MGSHFHLRPRFLRPPFSSRTVGFPESGWRLWPVPRQPSLWCRRLSACPHTPLAPPVCCQAREGVFVNHLYQDLCPEVVSSHPPPYAESPFARIRCYLLRRDVSHHISGRYSTFIAPMGSCASPKPSRGRRFPYSNGSLQVAASPCWELDLPDIISTILAWLPGPLPRSVPPVHLPVSSRRTPASPQRPEVRLAKFPL